MDGCMVTMVPARDRTRVLLTHGPDELLRAALPRWLDVRHRRAASVLLEALALWLDTRLRVVVSAEGESPSFSLSLSDEIGGMSNLFFEVEVLERQRRQRGRRLRGLGDFADVRQLLLFAGGGR